MKIDYQNKIEDYLFNRMSAEERLEFEQELEKNAELREQYEFISTLRTALMLENIENNVSLWNKAYKDELTKQDAAIEREYEATGSGYERTIASPKYDEGTSRSTKRHVLYWLSGIAAVFIVGFFMYSSLIVYDAAPSKQVKEAYRLNPQVVSTIRGIDVMTENLLAKGDYQKALTRIETIEDEIATELLVIERQKESRSIEDKELIEKQVMLNYRQEGLLILKVEALIRLSRMEEALSLMPQLDKIRNSNSEYKVVADSLYNVLK